MNDRKQLTGRKIIRILDSILNVVIIAAMVLVLLFGLYATWDTQQIYHEADSAQFQQYKPKPEDMMGFEEIRRMNKDVFAWITLYGTHVDYPVVRGNGNDSYINKNIFGGYSLSGSIFLDYRNALNFEDFNSIIYGHHMEKQAFFGELDTFVQKEVFDAKRYGNLYYDGKDHGLEVIAYLQVDGYDFTTYDPGVVGWSSQQAYIDYLLTKAVHKRDISLTPNDKLVLLSTCSSESTNGRNILLCHITDEVYENTFADEEPGAKFGIHIDMGSIQSAVGQVPNWCWLVLFIPLLSLEIFITERRKRRRRQRKRGETTRHD